MANTTILSISSSSNNAEGDEILLPVFIDDPTETDISALDIRFKFDSTKLELLAISAGELTKPWGTPTSKIEAGTASVALASANSLSSSKGEILLLRFRVKPGASGSTVVDLDEQGTSIMEGEVPFSAVNGSIEFIENSPVNNEPTGSVTINGIVRQGETLTATNTVDDGDGLGQISYQWQANGIAIPGANSEIYVLTQDELGKSISVVAFYTDGKGTAESLISEPTEVVSSNENQGDSASNTPPLLLVVSGASNLVPGLEIDLPVFIDDPKEADISAFDIRFNFDSTKLELLAISAGELTQPWGTPTSKIEAGTASVAFASANSLSSSKGEILVLRFRVKLGASGSTVVDLDEQATSIMEGEVPFSAVDGSIEFSDTSPVNNEPTGSVTINGIARQGETLSVTNTIDDADGISGTIVYQWKANGSPIQEGVNVTLTQKEVNKTISVVASYTDGLGNLQSVYSQPTAKVENINDPPIGGVTIGGIPEEGQILTAIANIQDDDGLAPISYQWLANNEAIAGAVTSKFIPTQAEVNKRISVRASYQDLGGTSESLVSDQTDVVLNVNSDPLGVVVIKGIPAENEILEADITFITDADGLGDFAFQWLADEEPIPGAISSTYALRQGDVGKKFKIVVSYTDAQGSDEELVSASTVPVFNVNNAPTGGLELYGVFEQGETVGLINSVEDEDGLGKISYQWLANDMRIPGATGETLILTQNEVGKKVSATASYIDQQGKLENVASGKSAPVVDINDLPVGNISIAGIPFQGQTLRAIVGSITDADGVERLNNDYTFSWERIQGGIRASIGGNSANYATTQDDVGANLQVTVTYKDKGGFINTITSQETTTILNINDRPTGAVLIDGDPVEGSKLTVVTGSLRDVDGLGEFKYQWRSNGMNILGANNSSYDLGQSDVGKSISVVVSYVDGGGITESLSSRPTPPITNTNNRPSGTVVIIGEAKQGQTLIASAHSIVDSDGLAPLFYQWLANGQVIKGAIGSQYTLKQADVGRVISVVASYVDGGGTSETLTSAETNPVEDSNDLPKGTPVIVGVLAVGFSLTASTNSITDVDGLGAFNYQWRRNGQIIPDAIDQFYVLREEDIGTGISVSVSYTDGQGNPESVSSTMSARVLSTDERFTGEVRLSGLAWEQGQPLSVDTSDLFFNGEEPNNLTYQWYANGEIIEGEDSTTFTPAQAQVGQVISVLVSATDEAGNMISKWASNSNPIENQNDAPTGEPIITGLVNGLPKEDVAIEINPFSIMDLDGRRDDFAYEWSVGGIVDADIQGSTFKPIDANVGKDIKVKMAYIDDYGNAESFIYSLGTVQNVNDAPTGGIALKGLLVSGQTLSVVDSIADKDGLTDRSYSWQRSVNDGIAWTTISQTDPNPGIYTLTPADAGSKIRVVATYTDLNGTEETVRSATTSRIIGQLSEGRRVTYSGANALDQLQWQLNGVDLAGEVGQSLLTANNWGGGSVQLMVAGMAASPAIRVEKINHGPGVVKPLEASGDLIPGVVLTAGTPLDDIDGIDLNTADLTYQWQRFTNLTWTDIDSATSASYATTEADVNSSLRAKISYIDQQEFNNVIFTNSLRTQANTPLDPVGSFSAITNDDILTSNDLLGDPLRIEGTFDVGTGNQGAVTITFGGQVRTGTLDPISKIWTYILTDSDEAFLVPGVNVIAVTLTEYSANNRGSKTFSRSLIIPEDALPSAYDPNSAADPTQADGIKQEVKDAARIALRTLGAIADKIGQPNVAAAPLGSSSAFLSGADAAAESYGVFELPGDTSAAGVTTYALTDGGYQIPDASGKLATVIQPNAEAYDTLSDPIALTIKDVELGATITINFTLPQSIADTLPEDLSQATYLKLKGNSFQDYRDSERAYYTYTDENGGPRKKGDIVELKLILTDGSEWDRDGIANGIIVDPGIFAALVPAPTDDNSEDSETPDNSSNSSGNSNTSSSGSISGNTPGPSDSGGTSSPTVSTTNSQTQEQAVAADGRIVDGNRDGIPDVEQATVFGLPLTKRGDKASEYGALIVEQGQLQSVLLTQPNQDGTVAVTTRAGTIISVNVPAGISNAFDGVVSFDAVGITRGGTTTATIVFPSDLPTDLISSYLRFNYNTNRFEEYVDAQGNPLYSFADGDGDGIIDRVILSLSDGHPSWDGDGVINGAVVDPGFAARGERIIRGTRANDAIIGNVLANTLIGTKANNSLFGDLGRDILMGKAGHDQFNGGEGADKLIGGAGRDTYTYTDVLESTVTDSDVISMSKEDRISLREVDANSLIGGMQSFDLIGNDRFSGVAGELRITKKGLFGDTDGDSIADFVIGFTKKISIASSQLMI